MQQTETTISITVKMENESKLHVVHFPRQNPMHICALWVELYRWTEKKTVENLLKIRTGPPSLRAAGPLERWVAEPSQACF